MGADSGACIAGLSRSRGAVVSPLLMAVLVASEVLVMAILLAVLDARADRKRSLMRGRYVGSFQVPVQAASEGLHVRCVLGSSGVRKAFPASRAALPRLSPCWSPVLPRWALDSDARALLQAARTQREATQVLACDLRLGAPDSACADTRTTY